MTDALRAGLAACGVGERDRLLVAVSGGVDSTVLLRLLVEIGHPVVAAHVDHGLRPESSEDAAFVAALAEELGVPFVGLKVEVGAGNVQAAARGARYSTLAEVARQWGCEAVATGHTATDQAETVLMALARGAGLRGLAGMPVRRMLDGGVDLVRPLLQSSRDHVLAVATARGWTWREDPTNATGRYRRNRLRHTVMPALRAEAGEEVDVRIAASAEAARAASELVATRLGDEPGLLPLAALADAEVGSLVDSGGLRVWRERDGLRFETALEAGLDGWLDVTPLAEVPAAFDPDPAVEVVDAERASGAVVRPWREGDRIRPLGLDGSQLVSDVLRSRGVPRAERARVPVVEVGGRVAWVVGHRLAADVALTESTRRAVRWTWRRGDRAG